MKISKLTPAFFIAVFALGSTGCSDREKLYPFYEWEFDTDTDSDTDTDTGTGDTPPTDPPTDTDECDETFLDDEDRCIRYVDWSSENEICGTSWDEAFKRIQDGIAAAYSAAQYWGYCEVWVAEGTYRSFEGNPTDTIRLREDVAVFGGFEGNETQMEDRDVEANLTILDGRAEEGPEASYHVVTGSGESTLDGFTITGGNASAAAPNHRGGGIFINSVPTRVRNCTIIHNTAQEGGGIFAWDSAPIIVDTVIRENTAQKGGGLYLLNGTPFLESVTIAENFSSDDGGGVYLESVFGACIPTMRAVTVDRNSAWGEGGGIYNKNCDPFLDGSVVSRNSAVMDGGGLSGFRGSTVADQTMFLSNTTMGRGGAVNARDNELIFTDVQVLWNSAQGDGGGLNLLWADGNLARCLIAGNSAQGNGGGLRVEMDFTRLESSRVNGNRALRGGGVYNDVRGDPDLVNCVLAGNLAFDIGGAIYNAELSEAEIVNSVIWDNGTSPVVDEPGSSTSISYSDVEGGYPGTCNADADPLFIAPGFFDDMGTIFDLTDDEWVPGDYRLSNLSPCVDVAHDGSAATSDGDGFPWEDMAGMGLPGVTGDMGAYDCKP